MRDLLNVGYVNGAAAAKLGYVNAGTDRRIGGILGRYAGRIQTALSFKSTVPPIRRVERYDDVWVEIATAPNNKPHISVATRRGATKWFTIRFGWRWDGNWGDAGTIGYNPDPEIIGGYIFDVVLKANAPVSFIAGVE